MSAKEEFIEIYRENIRRDGADALLDYLEHKSDFFTAPASARFHGAYAGGLCEHSVNVYHCLTAYLERERVKELYGLEYPAESVALVSLLHDVCKTGCYRQGSRNVKGPDGKWQAVPTFFYEDPCYGHGEKSVYILSGFLRLTREEAMAIRWHMASPATRTSGWWARPSSSIPWPLPQRGRHGGHLFPGKGGELIHGKARKRPGPRSHRQAPPAAGGAHRHRPVGQRPLQHRGPHLHRAHPR